MILIILNIIEMNYILITNLNYTRTSSIRTNDLQIQIELEFIVNILIYLY
jgi:hypothetical protein